jgi:PTH1 family peptidyl-tRNA hydrolase
MKVIVGLGNPGAEYEGTWHNLGFALIELLAERTGARKFFAKAEAKLAEVNLAGEKVVLAKPQTYMNLSGNSVRQLLDLFGDGDPRNLLVACDDIALPVGMIRVRPSGSAGGQKGLKSIIERIGSPEFSRVRLGIKPEHQVSDLADYVLSRIPRRLGAEVEEMVGHAADAIELIVARGVQEAMQAFNQRVKPEEPGAIG